jgi:hypothetical protein
MKRTLQQTGSEDNGITFPVCYNRRIEPLLQNKNTTSSKKIRVDVIPEVRWRFFV